MAGVIGSAVRQSSQSEGIFIQVGRISNERHYKITTTHVVNQVAEILVAERIVTHVLNHAAAVSVTMRLF